MAPTCLIHGGCICTPPTCSDKCWVITDAERIVSTHYGPARSMECRPGDILEVTPDYYKNLMLQQAQAYQDAPPVEDRKAVRMTKDSVTDEVRATVCGPREESYGGPEDNFGRIARHWTAFLHNRFGNEHAANVCLTASDVAALMILMKVARLEYNIQHHDSWVDAGGYAVCGAVCAANG